MLKRRQQVLEGRLLCCHLFQFALLSELLEVVYVLGSTTLHTFGGLAVGEVLLYVPHLVEVAHLLYINSADLGLRCSLDGGEGLFKFDLIFFSFQMLFFVNLCRLGPGVHVVEINIENES